MQSLRESLATRRRMLASAIDSCPPPSPSSVSPPLAQLSGSPGHGFGVNLQTARPYLTQRCLSGTLSHSPPPHTLSSTPRQPFPSISTNRLPHTTSASAPGDSARQIEEATYRLTALSDTISRARSGCLASLRYVICFHNVYIYICVYSMYSYVRIGWVGGRPPLGGKAGTKGEWTIGGLVLPVPGDMRRTFLLPSVSISFWRHFSISI